MEATRLKQAEAQYLASAQEQALEQQQHHVNSGAGEGEGTDQDHDQVQDYDDWRRRQRSLVDEAVVLGRKGSNVEAIVDGILKSHRSNGPLQTLPRHLKHRLHLCQLTSMVFGRFDIASSTNNCAGLNIYSAFHSRRHGASRAAIKHRFEHSEQGKRLAPFFAHPVVPSSYCRRHHHKDCRRTFCTVAKLQQEQQQELELKKKIANNYFMNSNHHHTNVVQKQEHQRVTGLVDAIPAFLKCSAMSYRDIAKAMVEGGELQEAKDMRVLDGWYRLLLELMTQAVIESYLCDENIGFDTILDVFSFGDDPEDQATALKDFLALSQNSHSSSAENTDEVDPSSTHSTTGTGMEGLQFQSLSGLGATSTLGLPIKSQFSHQSSASTPGLHDITTQDRQDDILFAKTPEYEIFKAAKDQRLQEILTLDGATMEQHFADLAATYPLIVFERQMTYFIARSQKLLVDPQLSQNHSMEAPMGLLIPPTTSSYADGSLSMPVSEDEDDDEDDGEDDTQTKLEGMKKEDEHEHEHRYQFPTPPATIVVIKEEKKKTTSVEDVDDDDNSTAARVVQVSKKHMHHHHHYHHHRQAEATTADSTSVDDAEHVAKKVKV
ncbi:hypothetical protein BGZ99_009553 [Dissophora globulifera]|uniref:Uncharacterized protein n=1 Tax=Dissophora globulifera TaxID=979702 RepID=A0A9P6RVB2_9FUNG|nr:hypothetical protein BGZ99_009553 [Dissophora globulifera]